MTVIFAKPSDYADFIFEARFGQGMPEGISVRKALEFAYGSPDQLPHVVHIASEHRIVRTGQFDYHGEDVEVLVIAGTTGRSVYGYEDTIGISNYRVLQEKWSHVEGLTDGPYSDSSCIALELDSDAPKDLIDVIESLLEYPVLDEEAHSNVEQEMIAEHWEDYGRNDTLDALAKAMGKDSRQDLTESASKLVDYVTLFGVLGVWPHMIDTSASEFYTEDVVEWIMTRLGTVVTYKMSRYIYSEGEFVDNPGDVLDLRRHALIEG